MLRVILAFLVAPFVVPIVIVLTSIVLGGAARGAPLFQWSDLWYGSLFYGIVAVPIAYLAELILGVPVWLVLSRRNLRSWPAFVGAGAILGCVVWLFFALFSSDTMADAAAVFDVSNPYFSVCALGGGASAATFRAIVYGIRR